MSDELTTATELRLEHEKLALEREMIALERERMAADRAQWALENDWQKKAASGLQVGVGILGLAIAVSLLLGVVVGYRTGFRKAEALAQTPRPIEISKEFLTLLQRTQFPEAQSPQAITNVPPFDFFENYKTVSPAAPLVK